MGYLITVGGIIVTVLMITIWSCLAIASDADDMHEAYMKGIEQEYKP